MKLPKVAKEDLEEGQLYIYTEIPSLFGKNFACIGSVVFGDFKRMDTGNQAAIGILNGEFYGPIELGE